MTSWKHCTVPSKTVNFSVANPRTSSLMVIENVTLLGPVLNVEVSMMYGEEPKNCQ